MAWRPIRLVDKLMVAVHAAPVAAASHATVATFAMGLSREAEQREGLSRAIVPSVSSSSGFVAGTWTLDRERSESVVMVTFDPAESADALAHNVPANTAHQVAVGLELQRIRLVEVRAVA